MMDKLIFLGSGGATGVPSISSGWGDCNPNNEKNIRQRAGIYISFDKVEILVDTSVDLKNQLIKNNIKRLDAVLYTHTHADHLHGIDDLRGITRNLRDSLNFYAIDTHIQEITNRFDYAFANLAKKEITNRPELLPNVIEYNQEFCVKSVHILPLEFNGHSIITTGYSVNDGKVVIIPDFRIIPLKTLEYLKNIDVDVLIMPLTMLKESVYHAGIDTVLKYVDIIKAKRVFLTHLSTECDYDNVSKITPNNVSVAYDNLMINL